MKGEEVMKTGRKGGKGEAREGEEKREEKEQCIEKHEVREAFLSSKVGTHKRQRNRNWQAQGKSHDRQVCADKPGRKGGQGPHI